MKNIKKTFGVNLMRMIDARGYKSVRAFARENRMDYQQICRYTKGEHLPSLITAMEIAQALQCTVDDLLKGAGN